MTKDTCGQAEHDSIQAIARDAASYAEGAGEPEFSQFLQIEARLLARMKAETMSGLLRTRSVLDWAEAHHCGDLSLVDTLEGAIAQARAEALEEVARAQLLAPKP